MTESEWLAWNDLRKSLAFLRKSHKVTQTKVGRRKLRLFGCACCRSIFWKVPVQDCYRQVVELAEQFADEMISRVELSEALARCPSPHHLPNRQSEDEVYFASWGMHETGNASPKSAIAYGVYRMAFDSTAYREVVDKAAKPTRAEQNARNQQLCGLLRDIFGNPFRPIHSDSSWLAWKDGTVAKIAESIYRDRDFQSMPILADALEEAGCSNSAILNHCREPAEHARGCWVVDLLLGMN